MSLFTVDCPYCNHEAAVDELPQSGESLRTTCPHCHRPFDYFGDRSGYLKHTNREVAATFIEGDGMGDFILECVENQFSPAHSFDLYDGKRYTIGRSNKGTEVDLPIVTDDPSIDRLHVRLSVRKGKLYITDAESRTGTFVNGLLLEVGEKRRIWSGDVITMGALSIVVHAPKSKEMVDSYDPLDDELMAEDFDIYD